MEGPVSIAFHHVEASDAVERRIRERIDALERLYGHMTSCRVRIEKRAKTRSGSVPPVIRIEIGIPGRRNLAVSYEPARLQKRYQTPDIRNAINDAFDAAERRLLELKNQRSRRSKQPSHDTPNQLLGQIAEVFKDADHGFILTAQGDSLYFHRNSVLSADFDKLERGDEVHYVETVGDTGPIATKVRVQNRRPGGRR